MFSQYFGRPTWVTWVIISKVWGGMRSEYVLCTASCVITSYGLCAYLCSVRPCIQLNDDQRSLLPCRDFIKTFCPGATVDILFIRCLITCYCEGNLAWMFVISMLKWYENHFQFRQNLDWVWNHIIFPIVIIGLKKKSPHDHVRIIERSG